METDANFWFLPLLSGVLSGSSAYIVITTPERVRKLCTVHIGTSVHSLVMALLFSSGEKNKLKLFLKGYWPRSLVE